MLHSSSHQLYWKITPFRIKPALPLLYRNFSDTIIFGQRKEQQRNSSAAAINTTTVSRNTKISLHLGSQAPLERMS